MDPAAGQDKENNERRGTEAAAKKAKEVPATVVRKDGESRLMGPWK
jgi:hypothetical protein